MIGVHVFAVDETNNIDLKATRGNAMIITLAKGNECRQYGPSLTDKQKGEIAHLLGSATPKVGADILWHAIDLKRILNSDALICPLFDVQGDATSFFKIWRFYSDCDIHRSKSMAIALKYSKYTLVKEEQPVGIELQELSVKAKATLIQRYQGNLPLFRLKWLEIQGVEKELKGIREVEQVELTPKDHKDFAHVLTSTRKFRIVQSIWDTHIVQGTRLIVHDTKGQTHEAVIRHIHTVNVSFVLTDVDHAFGVQDLGQMVIIRGGERQHDIERHLHIGKKLLLDNNPLAGGLQFCATGLSLHSQMETALSQYFEREQQFAQDDEWCRGRDTKSRWKARLRMHKRKLEGTHAAILEDKAGPHYSTLNEQQLRCVEIKARVVICEGYPGTGKTKTLAARVLRQFQAVIRQPSGWILCLAGTNTAALHILHHLCKYPSLRPYIKHKASKMYKAFHPSNFIEADQYRVTNKMTLLPHGIMVCTLGSLPSLHSKFPKLKHRLFEIITDEAGQIWEFDALLFLPDLPKMMRWSLFGDSMQLTPYVTKLVNQRVYFSSIMTLLNPQLAEVIRLEVQYRMIPALCNAHAPVFYNAKDYTIRSHRPDPIDPENKGLFLEVLPGGSELQYRYGGMLLLEYEVKRALDIFEEVQRRGYISDDGKAYSICILTPYHETLKMLIEGALTRELKEFKASTINTIQGCEENVIILTTSRTKCSDLNRCQYRGNVATSRAKDILIMMLHQDMATSCYVTEYTKKLRFWGQLVLHAKPNNSSVRDGRLLIREVVKIRDRNRMMQAYPSSNRAKSVKKTNKQYVAAGELKRLQNGGCILPDGEDRRYFCKSLMLQPKLTNVHQSTKMRWWAMCHCDDDQYVKVLECYLKYGHHRERTDAIQRILQLPSVSDAHSVPYEVDEALTHVYIT